MRILGQKGLFDPLQKSQVALIVISVILVGLVECKEKVRIFYNRKKVDFKKKNQWILWRHTILWKAAQTHYGFTYGLHFSADKKMWNLHWKYTVFYEKFKKKEMNKILRYWEEEEE